MRIEQSLELIFIWLRVQCVLRSPCAEAHERGNLHLKLAEKQSNQWQKLRAGHNYQQAIEWLEMSQQRKEQAAPTNSLVGKVHLAYGDLLRRAGKVERAIAQFKAMTATADSQEVAKANDRLRRIEANVFSSSSVRGEIAVTLSTIESSKQLGQLLSLLPVEFPLLEHLEDLAREITQTFKEADFSQRYGVMAEMTELAAAYPLPQARELLSALLKELRGEVLPPLANLRLIAALLERLDPSLLLEADFTACCSKGSLCNSGLFSSE